MSSSMGEVEGELANIILEAHRDISALGMRLSQLMGLVMEAEILKCRA